jgi:integrase
MRKTTTMFSQAPAMQGKQPYWLDSFFGKPIKPKTARAGIRLKSWHTLRHTYSTLLRANGNDPKVVQELPRHSKFATTMESTRRRSRQRSARLIVE